MDVIVNDTGVAAPLFVEAGTMGAASEDTGVPTLVAGVLRL